MLKEERWPFRRRRRRFDLNEYEKAFIEHMARLKIPPGPTFIALTKGALEGEFGGQGGALLSGLSQSTLGDPTKFAKELFKMYGDGAMQYFATIVRYAESGNFHPEEDQELEREEEELGSVVREVEGGSE
jgi:hypothetical protein